MIEPEIVSPEKVQNIVRLGFNRLNHFNKVVAMLFKSYVGQYYRETKGLEGDEPLNLVFNTIRAYVPNLVSQTPISQVITPYLQHKQYAELLGLGLDSTARQIRLKQTIRAWITNALFGWGIIKVGLAAKGELIQIDDVMIDPGQVYATLVSLNDFGFDPTCTDIRKAKSLWHRTTLPRQWLLDTDGYDHDLVRELPSSRTSLSDKLAGISMTEEAKQAMAKLQDEVDVVEMYVPEIESLVTMGDPTQKVQSRYIKVGEFNGPKEGPYVFLSYSPPVEGNPLPVAPVSIWYDLAVNANRVFRKMMEQVNQQKDVGLYNPAQVDEIKDIQEASTGDWIPSTDPKGVEIKSFGGQNPKNELMLQQLQIWYNYMSGNPDQITGNITPGTKGSKETATKAQILQSNASIGIEDMRDITYDQTAEIMRRIAWYLHTDPLIDLPLTKRRTGGEYQQLRLTPEERQGDFLDYTFKIVARSMTKLDPMVRSQKIERFCVNVIPSAAITAMTMMQIGIPFNLQRYLTRIAFEWGIGEWVEDLFDDPEFMQRMEIYMMLGPGNAGKAGGNSPAGVQQNNGNPMARPIQTPSQEFNKQAQETAAMGQSINQGAV